MTVARDRLELQWRKVTHKGQKYIATLTPELGTFEEETGRDETLLFAFRGQIVNSEALLHVNVFLVSEYKKSL